ncbi:MAG TPA: CvpA family protein [Acidimicrobiia bacterium]|nr:CvpA family protein [Acidimicrobiia bacterium]
MMIDVLALLLLAYLLLRGWVRGFVREAFDLAALIVGTVLAFRLAPLVGSAFTGLFGWSEAVARLAGGTIVFFGVGLGAALLTRIIEQRFTMPGLNRVNRAGGAGLAAAWGIFIATLVLTIGVVLPMPTSVAGYLENSVVSRTLTDPDGVPQGMFNDLAGDRIVEALINLRGVVGDRRVITGPGETLEIPPADPDDLRADPAAARDIFEKVNRDRAAEGLQPLQWRDDLAAVAAGHAREMYEEGYFAHESPSTGTVGDRLRAESITYRIAGENLALAATPTEVHNGLMGSAGHRANILGEDFTRIGIAVIRGPLGLMTVQVFTG